MTPKQLAELDRECALALGWSVKRGSEPYPFDDPGIYVDKNLHTTWFVSKWHPTSNRWQWAELLERFEIDVNKLRSSDGWCARVFPRKGSEEIGPTPGVAVVRAVIAMHKQ